jgi:hypothetical protein
MGNKEKSAPPRLMAWHPFQLDNRYQVWPEIRGTLYKAAVASAELAVTYVAGFPTSP